MKEKIKRDTFKTILTHCHLGGLVQECNLEIHKGSASIFAIDASNTMIIMADGYKVAKGKVKETIGLGNLEIILKFLSTLSDKRITAETDENTLTLRRPDGRRRLDYMLTDPNLISTQMEDAESLSDKRKQKAKFLSGRTHTFEGDSQFIKDLQSYLNTLKIKTTWVGIDEDDEVIRIRCGSENDHQFVLDIDEFEIEEEKHYSRKFDGDFISKVLSCVNGSKPVTIGISQEALFITQGKTTWGIAAIAEE